MGTFIMPKHSSDAFEFKMALKVCYDHREENDGWLPCGSAQNGIDGFSLYLYKEYHEANWKEHTVPKTDNSDYTKDAQLPAYFGFIDIRGQRNNQERRITEPGIRFLNAMNAGDSDKMHELILESIEHHTFGRNNAACGNSDSNCEAPGILVIASIALNGIKRKEFYYLLSTLDNTNIDFAHALARIMACRKDGTPVPGVDTVYTDAKFIPFLKEIGFLVESSELLLIEPRVYSKYTNRLLNVKTFNNEEDNGLYDSFYDTEITTLQTIYYGAPGTGKSHEVKKMTGELDGSGNDVERENVFRTTFHPDTDYATFVGCYKPMMKETGQQRKVNGKTEEIEEISYEFVPQTFTDAYIYALKHKDIPTYLVIEEINRGNCAQIFGDLFQLLDRNASGCSEYKIKPDKDLARYLAKELYDNSVDADSIKLSLPSNLNILATMNTSDQSLFPMDSAFKRRWDWDYVAISYDEPKSSAFKIDVDEKKYHWVDFIRKVNEKIFDLTQSEDKEMGNFFIKDSIDDKMFKSKVMFYLWNEVLRDEVGNGKYFFYYKDGDEKKQFTFKNLYGDDNIAILQGFMDYLEVEEIVNE